MRTKNRPRTLKAKKKIIKNSANTKKVLKISKIFRNYKKCGKSGNQRKPSKHFLATRNFSKKKNK